MEFLKRPISIIVIMLVVLISGAVYWGVVSSKPVVEKKLEAVALTFNTKKTVIIVSPGGPGNDVVFKGFEEELRVTYPGDPANLTIITKSAGGDVVKLKALVTEAVSQNPDLIVVSTGLPMTQALDETKVSKIPILALLPDPALHAYIPSNQSSETNLAGIAHTSIELTPKRFEILKQVFPGAKRVAVFYDKACGATRSVRPQEFASTPKLGLQVTEFAFNNPTREQLIEELKKVTRKDFDSIIFYPHLSMAINADLFLAKAREEKLAMILPDEFALKKGGLASYGPDFSSAGKQMSRLAIKILGGEDPQNIPFEQTVNVRFGISLPVAKSLGITVPESAIIRADVVIPE